MQLKKQPKIGRNDSCPCGSGKKYKKCCLRKKQKISGIELKCIDDISRKEGYGLSTNNNHYNPRRWTALWNKNFLHNLKNGIPHGSCKKAKVHCIDLKIGEIKKSVSTKNIFSNKKQFEYKVIDHLDSMEYYILCHGRTISFNIGEIKKIFGNDDNLILSKEVFYSQQERFLTAHENALFPNLRKIVIDIYKEKKINKDNQQSILYLLYFQYFRCVQAIHLARDPKSGREFFNLMEYQKVVDFVNLLLPLQWKIYKSKDSKFAMTDYSVLIIPNALSVEKILCPLSPELLLEINFLSKRTSPIIIFEEASQIIIDEYTNECIRCSHKHIISSNLGILEQIRNSELFQNRRKELGYL